MPWRLLRFALLCRHPEPRMFTQHDSLRDMRGVEIHQQKEVLGICVEGAAGARRQNQPQQHRAAQGVVRRRGFSTRRARHDRLDSLICILPVQAT